MADLAGITIYHIKEAAMLIGSTHKIQGFLRAEKNATTFKGLEYALHKFKDFQDFRGPIRNLFKKIRFKFP